MVIEPRVFGDDRGHFLNPIMRRCLQKTESNKIFLQDNQSLLWSDQGIAFSKRAHAQTKLVRVLKGKDIRCSELI